MLPAPESQVAPAAAGTLWRAARCLSVPRFYFHICNGDGFTTDDEGQELADAAAARATAVQGLRDIMASELKDGILKTASFIEIEDESHELIMTVLFSEAVRVEEPQVREPLTRKRPA